MQKEQIKKISGNIITVLIILAVFVVGYFSFVKQDTTAGPSVAAPSSSETADQVVLANSQVDVTIKSLRDLNNAVEKSMVLDTPAFTALQDLSVPVTQEPVGGRSDPFVPTAWKLSQTSGK